MFTFLLISFFSKSFLDKRLPLETIKVAMKTWLLP